MKFDLRSESGATAIEYGILAAAIAAVLAVSAPALGTAVSGAFQSITEALTPAG